MNNKAIININDIYNKNLNFLIGSGASHGLFPTLELSIMDESGNKQTIETLARHFDVENNHKLKTLLFMYYYKVCIKPALEEDYEYIELLGNKDEVKVMANYQQLIRSILEVLQRRKKFNKRCNIFTTNYDGCIVNAADNILETGDMEFVINDGTNGFLKRYLHAKNFSRFTCDTGVFERHQSDIPQINLVHLHGSIYWSLTDDSISVNYSKSQNKSCYINEDLFPDLEEFSTCLNDSSKTIDDIPDINLVNKDQNAFWDAYNRIPIVNPTKWKFHETVFEEHYYQMLRLLSYELEKPNPVLISFGFSFADEHIRNLIKRSLSNPKLQVFICCFNEVDKKTVSNHFNQFKNVQLITVDDCLNFDAFNNQVFFSTIDKEEQRTSDESSNEI